MSKYKYVPLFGSRLRVVSTRTRKIFGRFEIQKHRSFGRWSIWQSVPEDKLGDYFAGRVGIVYAHNLGEYWKRSNAEIIAKWLEENVPVGDEHLFTYPLANDRKRIIAEQGAHS
jgi:hypothetical protein